MVDGGGYLLWGTRSHRASATPSRAVEQPICTIRPAATSACDRETDVADTSEPKDVDEASLELDNLQHLFVEEGKEGRLANIRAALLLVKNSDGARAELI